MPIIKSAIKRVRQNKVRHARLLPYRSRMKTMIKKVNDLVKAGKKAEAEKALPEAFKSIDLAAKRNLLHKKTAARRKSSISRAVAEIGK